ncbi:MAG TPA: SDR family oxidoreductase [Terracidiphilus sp.]|nr:SDR family oxidoreductase [Terracidiphilus sp.]
MATVLITGTSKGIGLATALTLARAGHTVYATMRNPARAPELAEKAAQEGLPITIPVMDVDSDESVATAIGAIYETGAEIDVLVNNAGVERNGSIEELSMDDFRAAMETNYFGAVRCAKAVIPQMRERRSGLIINITSVAGRVSTSPLGPYAASKFALEALSEALAQEMKTYNVRVAIVEPGIIDTPMAREIELPLPVSLYPQQRRMAHYFAAALKTSRPPLLVAEKIKQIIETSPDEIEFWRLRHPVGPGAEALIESRKATSDEDYVALQAADDDTWYAIMEQRTGLALRPED